MIKRLSFFWLQTFFVCFSTFLFSQNTYYWVGDAGDGEWGSPGNWSNVSNGSGGSYLLPPSPVDDVVFDHNSFSVGNNIVRTSAFSGALCRNMTWTSGVTNAPIFEEHPETPFVILGNLTLQANVTFRAQILFSGNNPAVITSNGCRIGGNIYIDKPNTFVTLADSLMLYHVSETHARTGTIVLNRGTFDLKGNNIYANGFYSDGNGTRHINMQNSIMHFRSSTIVPTLPRYPYDYYENSSGTITSSSYCFTYIGTNKTVNAANSTVRIEYPYNAVNISGGTQLTFHNFEHIKSSATTVPSSTYSNSIINKITIDGPVAHNISSTSGIIDTVLCGIDGIQPNYYRYVGGSGTRFKRIEFRGIYNTTSSSYFDQVAGSNLQADSILFNTTSNDPNAVNKHYLSTSGTGTQIGYVFFKSRGVIDGASNNITKTYFDNHGYLSGNSNRIRFLEYNINGWMHGTGNIMDTLVFSPGYTYRFGVGVNNTVNKKWYASGNPCYFTEVYNVGATSTATITVNQLDPAEYDYIRFWGVTAAGSSAPIHAGVRSVDIANNTNIIFAPYAPLSLLYPFGTDSLSVCSTNLPITLNTNGFYGNTNTSFVWHDGSTLDSFVVNSPGIYTATANYGRNCYYTASLTVLDQLSVSLAESSPGSSIVCDPSNPTGEITANPIGYGSGPYTYSWNSVPIQTGQTLTGVPVGQYIVTVSDTSGCSATDTTNIIGPSTKLNVVASSIYPDCDPTSVGTGYISTTTTGGIAPYTYSWNTTPVQTTTYADQLNDGVYELVVTDSIGCISDTLSSVVPVQTGAFTSSVTVVNPTGCNTTGSASTSVVGGTSPFQYVWSNDIAEVSNTSSNIPIGNHNVLIVDANNCANNNPFTIITPDNIVPVFSGCPSNIVLSTTGFCGTPYTWPEPTATDNCGTVTVTRSHNPGYNFPTGLTTVTYTATDLFGNQSTCSFTVTVNDTEGPVFALCPNNITITANAGNCSATANWPTPIATDNCGIASIIGDFSPGSTFPVGVTTITYTATDVNGNTSTCTFDVIVKANPANFSMSGCSGDRDIYMYWNNISSTDSCATPVTLTTPTINNLCGNWWYGSGINSYVPGTYNFPIGVTPVRYYITNGADTLRCSYNVRVYDYANPQLVSGTMPNTISINADTCGGARVTWTPPRVIDNCKLDTVWSNYQPGQFFATGSYYVRYYAMDSVLRSNHCCGNPLEWYAAEVGGFYIYVNNPDPVINNCPTNISLPANTCGGAIVNWTPPTVTDNCYVMTSTHNPGDIFPVGNTTVIYTVTPQDGGSTRTCSFNVNVQPYTNTVTNCPSNITINLGANECDTTLSWLVPQFNHPCGVDSVISNYTPGSVFLPGSHNVNYTAYLGNSGGTLNCNFIININAYTAPVTITNCPSTGWLAIQVDTLQFCGETIVDWITPTFSTSTCISPIDTVVYTSTIDKNDTLTIGSYPIQYTAYDSNGNILGQCSFTLEVIDTLSEIRVSCPTDTFIQVNNSYSCDSAIVYFTIPQFESVGCATPIDSVYSNISPGDTLEKGTYWVEYYALDSNDIVISQCNFELIVGDTLSSLASNCPGTYNVNWGEVIFDIYMNPVTCEAVADWIVPTFSSYGSCAGIIDTVVQVSGITQGTTIYTLGSLNHVEYSALDSNGMVLETCRFRPVVMFHDSTFVFPSRDTIIFTDPITCRATVNWDTPQFGGYCGFTSSIGVNNYSSNWWTNNVDPYQNNANQSFPIGTYDIWYYYYNGAYGKQYQLTIHVVDGAQPTFNATCNTDTVTLYTNFNSCEATSTWPIPVATSGICSNNTVLPLVASHQQGTLLPIGYTTVVYTATSAGNLSETCEFVVNVIDNQAPSIYTCPADIIVQVDNGCEKVVTWAVPGVFDNCQNVSLTSSHTPGDTFSIGTTTVTYIATDASGNTSNCSFNVTVRDNISPVFANCPSNINVNNEAGLCGAIVSWASPSVTDNCTYTLTSTHSSGDLFAIGTTTVTYTATDTEGNSNSCSFNITVEDNTAPVITGCPSDIHLNNNVNTCGAIATWTTPIITDDCSYTLTASHNSGDIFPIGITVVTYTATDSEGNTSSCVFAVTVNDTELPVITNCPSTINVNSENSICGATVTWTIPVATDNCPNISFVSTHNSGTVFPIGTTTVTYTATDNAGNVSTCSFDVTVTDVTAPILLNCPSNITVNSLHNICASPVSWSAPTISDPCSNSIIYSSHQSGDIFNVGTTIVTYTVTDVAGNSNSCSFNVNVTDISAPQITSCPQNQTIEVKEGLCTVPAGWSTPIALDNCSGVTLTSTHNSGHNFAIGTTIVTYTATDDQGLQAVCSFSITVIDPNGYCGTPTSDTTNIKVPEAITPDGDGVNDFLVIKGIDKFPENELIIFNRWGNEVYREIGYSNQWDGFMNVGKGLEGTQLPTGTYFYVLDTKDKIVGVLKGYIYLQR